MLQGEEEILRFFNKIDYNCDNYIDWVSLVFVYPIVREVISSLHAY